MNVTTIFLYNFCVFLQTSFNSVWYKLKLIANGCKQNCSNRQETRPGLVRISNPARLCDTDEAADREKNRATFVLQSS